MYKHIKKYLTCRLCGADISDKKTSTKYCCPEHRDEYRIKYKKIWYENNKVRVNKRRKENKIKAKLRKEQQQEQRADEEFDATKY